MAAVEEERFTRLKHDTSFPHRSIRYCLENAGLRPEDIDHFALSRNPRANLGRRVLHALKDRAGRQVAPRRASNLRKILRAKATLAEGLGVPASALHAKPHFVEHHLAHIGSSFYVSPFERAAVLSIDGFGDMVSAMWGVGRGSHLQDRRGGCVPPLPRRLLHGRHAVPRLPQVRRRVQGDGPRLLGEPEHLDVFRRIVRSDGLGYELSLDYFRHHVEGAAMTWDGGSPSCRRSGVRRWNATSDRLAATPLGAAPPERGGLPPATARGGRPRDAAAAPRATGTDDLCLAGGVALNCVVNGKIFDETPFRRVYIQPAAYDGGTSVGAAYHVWHQVLGRPRGFVMDHAYWGPEFGDARLKQALQDAGVAYAELPEPELLSRTADALADGKVVGWYQGGWSSARGRSATARSSRTRGVRR